MEFCDENKDPELSWKEPFFITTASKLSHLSVLLSRVTLADFWIREKKKVAEEKNLMNRGKKWIRVFLANDFGSSCLFINFALVKLLKRKEERERERER